MVSPQDGPAGGYQASLIRSAMLSLMVRGTDKAAGPHARSSSSPTSGAETRDRVPATPSGHPLPRSRSTPRARGSLPGEGEHRRAPGRETKRSPRPEDASRGSHNLQKPRVPAEAAGFPTTPPKSPPRRDRGRRLSVSLSRRTEEELAGPPVSFPPPAHHPVTLWGVGGGAPVPAEAAAPFPRNHVGGRRQRPPPPPQRWEARPGRLPRRQGGLPPLPSTPSTPPEGREGWASHRPSS